ncbi:hypothetical protein HN018_27070 (plasmid) [Lichenicola cladoniae]|uniref:Uncharacterized protein n=1 Tax=Lichenicola cladoniae TaxID=1484109 RepID=A0A6M8HZX1_9PROT|nr:DUF5677 domain-containing protein [Lichenicola cladoniae]NPD70186.1 hypothetical protein [Acetobacteraceae bacterium]QKE93786.1 hypothetical protein HN018_27070 [Lichenicola cladoniae]
MKLDVEVEESTRDKAPRSRSEAQIRDAFSAATARFDQAIRKASRRSVGASGIQSPTNQHYWASVLFTRLVVTAMSVRRLLPKWKAEAHCDFSAVASLTRNLAECYLFYFFLCIDDVPQVEKDARIILLNLHDDGTRTKLMAEIDDSEKDAETIAARAVVRADLAEKFYTNAHLAALPERRQKELLRGEKTPFVQDDVIDRTSLDKANFRILYRLFSAHTHTGPISFYRMAEHGRGHGVANSHDARYICHAVNFATDILERASDDLIALFPDADERGNRIKSGELRNRPRRTGRGKR